MSGHFNNCIYRQQLKFPFRMYETKHRQSIFISIFIPYASLCCLVNHSSLHLITSAWKYIQFFSVTRSRCPSHFTADSWSVTQFVMAPCPLWDSRPCFFFKSVRSDHYGVVRRRARWASRDGGVQVGVYSVVTPCSVAMGYQRLWRPSCLHPQGCHLYTNCTG
jgi:hypothetical protein